MALTCRRDAFSLPADVHYLNCAYMGPLPVRAQEAGEAGIRAKAVPIGIAPGDFFESSDRARRLFAGLIGTDDSTRVAIVPAVSYALAIVAANLRAAAGSRIVVAGEQFPSNVYAWRRMARRHRLDIVTVDPPDGPDRGARWNDAILSAIDERTALVALPQVHWTDGTRFDLESIGAAARRHDAAFVIDATQSIGTLPFDVGAVGADAVACAGYKWLLGPYGLGYVWLGPRFDDAEPLEETWIGRLGSEDFRGLVAYRDEYQPGAARFDVGERSNFILLPMSIAAMELITEWTPAAVQTYCAELMEPAIAEARSLGFMVEDADRRAAHLFGLRTPIGLDLDALAAALHRRRVHASLRGSALRVAPNVYNGPDDVAALIAALRDAVGRRAFTAAGAPPASPSTPPAERAATR